MIRDRLARVRPELAFLPARYEGFGPRDIRHSHAEISKAIQHLGYAPRHSIADTLVETMDGYVA